MPTTRLVSWVCELTDTIHGIVPASQTQKVLRFDSEDAGSLCAKCGMRAQHADADDCISDLRNVVAELEFRLNHTMSASSRAGAAKRWSRVRRDHR